MTLSSNIRWGVRWGLRMACVFCVWILVLMLINRSITLRLSSVHAISGFSVLALYLGGGVAAGAIVGVMRPLLKWKIGAMATGALAAVPLFLGFRIAVRGLAPWQGVDTFIVAVGALTLGPLTAVLIGEVDTATEKTR